MNLRDIDPWRSWRVGAVQHGDWSGLTFVLACGLLPFLGACLDPSERPPSVLLVTMDTTRADHLGPYGYLHASTPNLDELARAGTRWTRAYSSAPLTIPSHSTILTGRYPPSHGVRDNGDFILGAEQVSLAERFAEADYSTFAVTAAFPTQARWGFDQGFDLFHDPLERPPQLLDWRDQRTAEEVAQDFIDTLADQRGPVFAWLHFFDPHWPYEPPEAFRDPANASTSPEALYDGEISYMDHELGRVLRAWDERFPGSTVLVTADHGEGLGDGGEVSHGFLLHDGTIHIPLIATGPGFEEGAFIDDPVSHVDIAPTLLAVAGLAPHEGLQGRDLREGGTDRPYSEALTGQYSLGLAPLFAWSDERGRFTRGGHGDWYRHRKGSGVDSEPDPSWEPGVEESILAEAMAAMEPVEATVASLDSDTLGQLLALGYVGGDPLLPAGTTDPRDVIEVIPLTWRAREAISRRRFTEATAALELLEAEMPGAFGIEMLRAALAHRQGDLLQARQRYFDLFSRAPSSTLALHLADLAMMSGEANEAWSWYHEALALNPVSPEAMAGLVTSALALGQEPDAWELVDEFLSVYPGHSDLLIARSALLHREHRLDEALELAETASRGEPHSTRARLLRAQILWDLGRSDEALALLDDALRDEPYATDIRLLQVNCLIEVGRNAEAHRLIAPLARLFPESEAFTELAARARLAIADELAQAPAR